MDASGPLAYDEGAARRRETAAKARASSPARALADHGLHRGKEAPPGAGELYGVNDMEIMVVIVP
ncbi:hypothetical protein [Streptomyces sp. NPDC059994]|uniref:hypothetical protein n=1 Tax=Streptomyces sp. NPDC059994 TaxID=3347029 RepID=UPI003673CFCE